MGYCGMNRSKSVVSSGSVLFFVLFIWNFRSIHLESTLDGIERNRVCRR